jgi:aminoglycoside phosphotransferase (APT) family kinase protein
VDTRHPPAEVHVDADLVRRLLASQHPEFLPADITLVDEGWDNVTYRLGESHAVRLPRRETAVQLLLNEQRWLPVLAPRVALEAPVPVALGRPSDLFPWPWSVVRWIEGATADPCSLSSASGEALAGALRALHLPAPEDAPPNPFRGVPLEARRAAVEDRLARLGLDALLPLWKDAMDAEPSTVPVWLHGDLHPRNAVVRDGRLVGLLDWGDLTAGDPATDLGCAWMLFGPEGRSAFLEAYSPSAEERARAMGWAVNFASAHLDSAEPRHVAIGQAITEQLRVGV